MADYERRGTAVAPLAATYKPLRQGGRFVALGDSLSNTNSGATDIDRFGTSWFNRACPASGQKMQYVHNAGVVGNTTDQMLARVQTDVIAYAPDYCTVLGGTNDIHSAGNPASHATANLQAIYTALLAAGITPVLATITPRTDCTSAQLDEIDKLNAWVRAYARWQRLPLLDLHRQMVSPTDRGAWINGAYTSDGIHPSELGAELLAQYVSAQLSPLLPPWLAALTDDNVDATNLVPNGLFETIVSLRASSWNLTDPLPTFTPATLGVAGQWANVDTTGKGNVNFWVEITTGFSVGDLLAFSAAYQIDAIPAGNFSIRVYFTQTTTGDVAIWQAPKQWTAPTTPGVANRTFVMGRVPANTTKIRFEVASTGAGAVWRAGEFYCADLTTLGLDAAVL